MLSRRGLHKTALEVCKLLLALNHHDPMGALFAIDYLAGGPGWVWALALGVCKLLLPLRELLLCHRLPGRWGLAAFQGLYWLVLAALLSMGALFAIDYLAGQA